MNYQQTPHMVVKPPKWTPEEYAERAALKNGGNAVGVSIFILEMVMGLISIGAGIVLTLVLGESKAYEVLTSPMFTTMAQIYISVLGMTVPFIIGARIMKFKCGQLMSFKRVEINKFVPLVMLAFGIGFLGNFASAYLDTILTALGQPVQNIELETPKNIFGELAYFMAIAIFAPFVEEFAFRGVVLGGLRRFGDGFAIFVSAALFSLIHGNLAQIPFAFVGGLILGYVTVESGSMWPAITVHMINNSLSILINEYGSRLSDNEYYMLNNLVTLLAIFLGLIGTIWFLKNNPSGFRLKAAETKLSGRKKLAAFVSSPGMIGTLVILGINLILVQFLSGLI